MLLWHRIYINPQAVITLEGPRNPLSARLGPHILMVRLDTMTITRPQHVSDSHL